MAEPRFPDELMWVIEHLDFKRPGWRFGLSTPDLDDDAPSVLTLYVTVTTDDFYRPGKRHTRHEFIVPPATYNRSAWSQWLLDCIDQIDHHESSEAFVLDGVRVFAPRHGPGFNPYHHVIYDATDEQRRTAPGGEVQEA